MTDALESSGRATAHLEIALDAVSMAELRVAVGGRRIRVPDRGAKTYDRHWSTNPAVKAAQDVLHGYFPGQWLYVPRFRERTATVLFFDAGWTVERLARNMEVKKETIVRYLRRNARGRDLREAAQGGGA